MEVNIKIACGAAETAGNLTRPERNKLLASMTDDVAQLVLRNNYQQTLSLTLAQTRGADELGFQARFMRDLEVKGELNRAIEFLPDEIALVEREASGQALTRPELSVLLAYAKISLFDQLLDSSVPDLPYLEAELLRYFPTKLQTKYSDVIGSHRLRREIISTMLANSMINRGGPTFVSRLVDETGADVSNIAAAYALARDSFSLVALNTAVDALDNKVSNHTQMELYLTLQTLLRQQTVWYLRNVDVAQNLEAEVKRFKSGIDMLAQDFNKIVPKTLLTIVANEIAGLSKQKVPIELAEKIARLRFLQRAPEIIMVSEQTARSLDVSAATFFAMGEELQISRLVAEAGRIDVSDYFDRLALNRQIDNLQSAQRGLSADVLRLKGGDSLQAWQKQNEDILQRTQTALSDMFASGEVTLAKMAVASGYIRDLLKS
jgi:glutamate dehydrogenase